MKRFLFIVGLFFFSTTGLGKDNPNLSRQLDQLRKNVLVLEKRLIRSLKGRRRARVQMKNLKRLLRLHREERQVSQRRLNQLKGYVKELESRRKEVGLRISRQQSIIRDSLQRLDRSYRELPQVDTSRRLKIPEKEKFEAPRRRVLLKLVNRSMNEIEALRADLEDADRIEKEIETERSQLTYIFQDMKEREGVIELHRQLQRDILQKNYRERISQLENYRKLKIAEQKVRSLISDFNARRELERVSKVEAEISLSMRKGEFASLKGALSPPLKGSVISKFGRVFDQKSKLYVFKKGVEIRGGKNMPVRAISHGKVAYAGKMPKFGRVLILDHGGHYYSLMGHLGEVQKKTGDVVSAKDVIGLTEKSGRPIYFEIRSRNVAVNPLQWVSL